jgi:hypothetical protein
MAKGLVRSLKVVVQSHSLHGLSLHNFDSPLSHNQFFDDTMLMGVPSAREAREFKRVMDDFMEASCTSINHHKSQIFLLQHPSLFNFMCPISLDSLEAPFHPITLVPRSLIMLFTIYLGRISYLQTW